MAHYYDPATAGLAEFTLVFDGELRDERVEAKLSRFALLVTLTVVSTLWAMTADTKEVKVGLAEIRADVEWAVASAVEAFTADLRPATDGTPPRPHIPL